MRITRRIFAASIFAGSGSAQGRQIQQNTVFAADTDGYHTFRIPALLTTAKGAMLAFAEGRRLARGDSGAIDLVVKRSDDGGASWSKPHVIWRDGEHTCGNPCPVVDRRNGRILLPMTWNRGDDHGSDLHKGAARDTRKVFLTHSDDEGKSWVAAREITAETKSPDWWWYATGPGVAIQVRNGEHAGRIVVPANHTSEKSGFAAHVIFSDDGGEAWRRSAVIAPACNESQVVELSAGRLMMNMRNQSFTNEQRTGYRSIAFSSDGGETWTPPKPDAHLGDPQVQASLIRYSWPDDSGVGRLLFANPSPPISRERGKRVRMTVRLSTDDGKTWPAKWLLNEGPSAYSSLARLPDGSVGLLYEAGRENAYESIRLARFSIEDLERRSSGG